MVLQQFVVTQSAVDGGRNCSFSDGATRFAVCQNSTPCPVSCTGAWVRSGGSCTGDCGGGAGLWPEVGACLLSSTALVWAMHVCRAAGAISHNMVATGCLSV